MKKIVLIFCFGLMFTSSCIASPMTHLLAKMAKFEKTTAELSQDPDEDGYTDFSGVWVGTCDDEPDSTDTFNIKMTDSSIIMNDEEYDIDAVSTKGIKNNLNFNERVFHFRWNEEGSQLLATVLDYNLDGYMATAKMTTWIAKMTLSMENNQLITRLSGHLHADDSHLEEFDVKTTCTYNRKPN